MDEVRPHLEKTEQWGTQWWMDDLEERLETLIRAKATSDREMRQGGGSRCNTAPNLQDWAYLRQDILCTAQKHKFGSGKWLIFAPIEHVDQVWGYIATQTVKGALGSSAKVAPCTGTVNDVSRKLICVYVEEYWDCLNCLKVLEDMLQGWSEFLNKATCTGFKPDIFTVLGIQTGAPIHTKFRKMLRDSDQVLGDQPLVKWEEGRKRLIEAARARNWQRREYFANS